VTRSLAGSPTEEKVVLVLQRSAPVESETARIPGCGPEFVTELAQSGPNTPDSPFALTAEVKAKRQNVSPETRIDLPDAFRLLIINPRPINSTSARAISTATNMPWARTRPLLIPAAAFFERLDRRSAKS